MTLRNPLFWFLAGAIVLLTFSGLYVLDGVREAEEDDWFATRVLSIPTDDHFYW